MRLTTAIVSAGLVSCSMNAAAPEQTPELPSQARPVQKVLVPVPNEIFRLLDQFGNANWRAVQRPQVIRWKSYGDQVQVALLLGAVVAEGFVAMEAKDSPEVKKIGNRVLVLARALGVEKTALRRSKSIIDNANAERWAAARQEWDGVLADLERGMIALESEPLSQLVSLSGWLRGTDALCVLVTQDYSPERADVIREPAMIDYLAAQLAAMKPEIRNKPMVAKLESGLRDIRGLIGDEGAGTLTEDKVKKIGQICDELVRVSSQPP